MVKPLHQRIIPETYVQLLFEYLETQGHDPESVLGEAWPIPNPNGLGGVAVEHWQSLLETARSYLNDPLIGLHVGQTITARHLGFWEQCFQHVIIFSQQCSVLNVISG